MLQESISNLSTTKKWLLGILCLFSGVAPLTARWIHDDSTKVIYGVVLVGFFLIATILIKKSLHLRQFWELSFAFFIFALIQVLNNTLPGYIRNNFLHQNPVAGNPLASTVSGTLAIQFIETLIAIIPIILLTKLSGRKLNTIYLQKGKIGKWFVFSIIAFFVFYILSFRISSHHLFPIHGTMTLSRYLMLTPALFLMVLSNGFQEELLFRGLFLQEYKRFFRFRNANILQAVIFTVAHIGVTYTPLSLVFLFAFVFPIGLFTGYLMNKTKSVIAPVIFHAGADIPIYLAFLTFVS